jgi:AcrR family transcriptional regulator
MARQSRSEVTRRKIIDSAVDLINEIGYPAAGLADIIERAELTKGALYYHFDSKEALATVIIEEGMALLLNVFQAARDSGPRALQSVIVGTYAASDLLATDRTARAGARLLRTFDGLNPVSKFAYQNFVDQFTTDIVAAAEQGDLRSDVRPDEVTETLVTSILGIEVLSSAVADRTDMRERFTRLWNVVLPAIVTADALDEYRAILAATSIEQAASVESDAPRAHIAN